MRAQAYILHAHALVTRRLDSSRIEISRRRFAYAIVDHVNTRIEIVDRVNTRIECVASTIVDRVKTWIVVSRVASTIVDGVKSWIETSWIARVKSWIEISWIARTRVFDFCPQRRSIHFCTLWHHVRSIIYGLTGRSGSYPPAVGPLVQVGRVHFCTLWHHVRTSHPLAPLDTTGSKGPPQAIPPCNTASSTCNCSSSPGWMRVANLN